MKTLCRSLGCFGSGALLVAMMFASPITTTAQSPSTDKPADKPTTEKTDPAKKYKPIPWHLADIWWDLGEPRVFQSYSIDVTLSEDVPETVNLYIAPLGAMFLNKTQLYGGMQTQADGHTRKDARIRKIGRGLLMSMWGERSLDAIRPGEGGFCQSSGHEGDFVSIRRPFAWKKGTYTYRVARMDEQVIDGKTYIWLGAFLISHASDETIFIGGLRFPGEKLMLGRSVANFVEIYGRAVPVEDIPRTTITFANPRVNGDLITPTKVSAVYPSGVPDYADAKFTDKKVVIELGQEVKDRGKRNVVLMGP